MIHRRYAPSVSAALTILFLVLPVFAEDWPQFRGPDGRGVSSETGLPVRWGPGENMRWKADLPGRGVSGPVVARGRVYVTACSGPLQERLHVLCFDAATGKKVWERQLWATGNTLCHAKTCMAGPTPVTDGERVYALFATGDLACFDAGGMLVWYRALCQDYPNVSNQVGMAASPILWNDVLIVPLESAGDSLAAGLDKLTGRNRWKVDRPRDISWGTPLLVTHGSGDRATDVIFASPKGLTAYDPATGRKRWSYRGPGLSSIPSAIAADGLVLLPSGAALRPPPNVPPREEGGGEPAPEVVWKTAKLHPAYATPLSYRGRLYVINGAEILHCAELQTGKVLWRQRLKGSFSASPVAGDGKLYLVNEEGLTFVVEPGDEPRIVSENALGEMILATPAIAGGALFLRSHGHLYCIGRKADHR
jgi:outer membrane protein assembly factor BamB